MVNGVIHPPHTVTGNKMRFEKVMDLLHFLFLWDDNKQRLGWGSKPYRVILQKTFEMIERRLGHVQAQRWLDHFFHLVRLTHWILPYPSNTALIMATKTSRNQGLQGRMMWFSVVHAAPETALTPAHWLPTKAHTLHNILWYAQRNTFEGAPSDPTWATSQLITACKAEGLQIRGQEAHWVAGKKSIGSKGFRPIYVRSLPPKLGMLEQIKGKSLNELEELMAAFSQEQAAEDARSESDGAPNADLGNDTEDDADLTINSPVTARSGSIFAQFARRPSLEEAAHGAGSGSEGGDHHHGAVEVEASSDSEEDLDQTRSTAATTSSGSIFTPFARRR